jgi:hypothetical protein
MLHLGKISNKLIYFFMRIVSLLRCAVRRLQVTHKYAQRCKFILIKPFYS